jgi:hypothetical protein
MDDERWKVAGGGVIRMTCEVQNTIAKRMYGWWMVNID